MPKQVIAVTAISSNQELQKMAKEYRFKGDGTPDNPFVWQIKNAKLQMFEYIKLSNITLHLIIECVNGKSIDLRNCCNITIRNSILCPVTANAIVCENCEYISIYHNVVYEGGMMLNRSDYCHVINNILVRCPVYGVAVNGSNCLVLHNIIMHAPEGLALGCASDVTTTDIITKNVCIHCQTGIGIGGGTAIPIRHIIHNNVILTPNQLSYFVNAVHEIEDETTVWTHLYDICVDNETTNHIISCNLCLSDFINIYVTYGTSGNKQFIPDVVYNVCLSFSALPGIIPIHYVMGNKMPCVINAEKFYIDILEYARTHNEKEVLEFIKKEFCKFGW